MEPQVNPRQIDAFIASQIAEWPQAAGNFEALKGVKVKEVELPGWTVKVQFNPARIVSSSAKVDAASLKARKCFLCKENRPDVQRGIEWGGRYTCSSIPSRYSRAISPYPTAATPTS